MATFFVRQFDQTDGVAEVPDAVILHASIQEAIWDKTSVTLMLCSLASPDELRAWGLIV